MKELYYIRAYRLPGSGRGEAKAKFLVTGLQSIAEDKVLDCLGPGWTIRDVTLVCTTYNDVFLEV